MSTRPLDVLCPKWEAASPGSKACRYYLKPRESHGPLPGTDADLPLEKEGPSSSGLCALPTEMLCVEWVRRKGTHAQQKAIGLPAIVVAPPPEPHPGSGNDLSASSPGPSGPPVERRIVRTPFGEATVQMPPAFVPAKGIDPKGLEALEQAGVEVELSAPYLADGFLAIVAVRTGRTDRPEITFREAATLRLIVDAFPGSHVVGYKAAPGTHMTNGIVSARDVEREFKTYPLTGTRCSECKEPQRMTPGGESCANGHGGASPEDVIDDEPKVAEVDPLS